MTADGNKIVISIFRWLARVGSLPTFAFNAAMFSQFIFLEIPDYLQQDYPLPLYYWIGRFFFAGWVLSYPLTFKRELAGGMLILIFASLFHERGEISAWNQWMSAGIAVMLAGYALRHRWEAAGGYVLFGGAVLLISSVYEYIGLNRGFWLQTSIPALLFILTGICADDLQADAEYRPTQDYWAIKLGILTVIGLAAFACVAIS